jgi:hypothetical protein
MKKLLIIIAAVSGFTLNAQIYQGKDGGTTVTFFSKSPLEDIEAVNKPNVVIFNSTTGDFQTKITMTGFKFKSALMQEHFNENYVESEKFPYAIFRGKINEKLDLTKDGEYKVTVNGTMDLHGVKKDVVVNGTVTRKGNDILVNSGFKLAIADYNIKVPSLYVQNIAEVVDVTINSTLAPYVKK